MTVDPAASTTTLAGGATNADVGDGMSPYGVYFPGGRCLSVGMSGLTLGGGWGFSCRHLGMTCDNLLATEAVTASGEIVTASETENADLFWAVRGAGHGNFGVHTSFTYTRRRRRRRHRLPPGVERRRYAGAGRRPLPAAGERPARTRPPARRALAGADAADAAGATDVDVIGLIGVRPPTSTTC